LLYSLRKRFLRINLNELRHELRFGRYVNTANRPCNCIAGPIHDAGASSCTVEAGLRAACSAGISTPAHIEEPRLIEICCEIQRLNRASAAVLIRGFEAAAQVRRAAESIRRLRRWSQRPDKFLSLHSAVSRVALLCRLNADWVATIDCLEVPRLTVLAASMCSMCDILNADDLDGRREPPVLA
jgi:hypothetical protein